MSRAIGIALLLVAFAVSGCGTEHPFRRGPERAGDVTEIPPGAEVSFSQHVKPLLQSCTGCHASGAGGWTYNGGADSYAATIGEVNTANPALSSLLVKATGGGGHGGGTIFSQSSDAYAAILRWIEEGAQDN